MVFDRILLRFGISELDEEVDQYRTERQRARFERAYAETLRTNLASSLTAGAGNDPTVSYTFRPTEPILQPTAQAAKMPVTVSWNRRTAPNSYTAASADGQQNPISQYIADNNLVWRSEIGLWVAPADMGLVDNVVTATSEAYTDDPAPVGRFMRQETDDGSTRAERRRRMVSALRERILEPHRSTDPVEEELDQPEG